MSCPSSSTPSSSDPGPRPRSRPRTTVLLLLLILAPAPLWAATGSSELPRLFLVLAAMLVGAKLFGDLAERIGQPAVLGELVAGMVLGASVLGVIPSTGSGAEIIHALAELGVVLLLFEIGLETDLREMFRVGPVSLSVAAVGVVLPFFLGYFYWRYASATTLSLPESDPTMLAIFVGATLTATSVGITARVLSDLGKLRVVESKIIIGAAVIDDVLGLVILTVMTGLVAGATVSVVGVSKILLIAVGFLVAAVAVGHLVAPRLFNVVDRMQVRHVLVVFALAFVLGLSALASLAGSALIIGAFAAGIILSGTNQFEIIEERLRPVTGIFSPLFFVSVGSSVDVALLNPSQPEARGILVAALVLTLLAIVGKLAAGWAAPWRKFRRALVGIGMVPRGEVGLIFVDVGRQSGVLPPAAFNALLLMVMATTFLGPIALKAMFGRRPEAP